MGAIVLASHLPTAAPIIGKKCHYCSRFICGGEYRIIGESVVMCWACQQRHDVKVEGLNPPAECQGCHTSTELLQARARGARWSMFLHWRDGEYQMLCAACSDAYIGKRKDLYGGTRFGWQRKLK